RLLRGLIQRKNSGVRARPDGIAFGVVGACAGEARNALRIKNVRRKRDTPRNFVAMSPDVTAKAAHDDIMYSSALPFVLVHLGCIAAIWSGVTGEALALCVMLYLLRMFAIGAGYHRYFSH